MSLTCIAHFLHNYANKVKSQFQGVDQAIPQVKAATIKNQTRQAKLAIIGQPHHPAVIEWEAGNSCFMLCKYLSEVKPILENFKKFGD